VPDTGSSTAEATLRESLLRLIARPPHPPAGSDGENLPWDEPAFSERMLREHLDESHGAASRQSHERDLILDWLWEHAHLEPGLHLLDLACGPGLYAVPLAERGLNVTGIDFAPAAIEHARALAHALRVEEHCSFVQADIRAANFGRSSFDVAMVLYGQLSVFRPAETRDILERLAVAVGPGGVVVLELLDADAVERAQRKSWYAAERGLWSDAPHLVLSERDYDESAGAIVDRYHVIDSASGALETFAVVDYLYTVDDMVGSLNAAGFDEVEVHRAWGRLALADAQRWVVYVARAGPR
jgi:2-polyprenyl-3-methyl-5-hydroxy-6-metoxy-1,4-benzoquinol methylase